MATDTFAPWAAAFEATDRAARLLARARGHQLGGPVHDARGVVAYECQRGGCDAWLAVVVGFGDLRDTAGEYPISGRAARSVCRQAP